MNLSKLTEFCSRSQSCPQSYLWRRLGKLLKAGLIDTKAGGHWMTGKCFNYRQNLTGIHETFQTILCLTA
jgi:hypothetical protein